MIFHQNRTSLIQKNFKTQWEKFHLTLILNNHSVNLNKIKKKFNYEYYFLKNNLKIIRI